MVMNKYNDYIVHGEVQLEVVVQSSPDCKDVLIVVTSNLDSS